MCRSVHLKARCSAQSEYSSLLNVSRLESRSSVDNSSLQWILGVIGTSPLQYELIVICEACLIIRHHHLLNACIKSDCKIAISFYSTESAPPWDSAVLIEDIRSIATAFHIIILFVPRSYN